MTPFQKAGEGSVSLMESSFLWTIWQQVAPLFPSFCLNGHADSDMIFHIKGAKRSETECQTYINVISSCVASRPWQRCPLSLVCFPHFKLRLMLSLRWCVSVHGAVRRAWCLCRKMYGSFVSNSFSLQPPHRWLWNSGTWVLWGRHMIPHRKPHWIKLMLWSRHYSN